jgi:hypothetical protein
MSRENALFLLARVASLDMSNRDLQRAAARPTTTSTT